MPSKEFLLDNGLAVTIYKRRGSRNLRLSIGNSAEQKNEENHKGRLHVVSEIRWIGMANMHL